MRVVARLLEEPQRDESHAGDDGADQHVSHADVSASNIDHKRGEQAEDGEGAELQGERCGKRNRGTDEERGECGACALSKPHSERVQRGPLHEPHADEPVGARVLPLPDRDRGVRERSRSALTDEEEDPERGAHDERQRRRPAGERPQHPPPWRRGRSRRHRDARRVPSAPTRAAERAKRGRSSRARRRRTRTGRSQSQRATVRSTARSAGRRRAAATSQRPRTPGKRGRRLPNPRRRERAPGARRSRRRLSRTRSRTRLPGRSRPRARGRKQHRRRTRR